MSHSTGNREEILLKFRQNIEHHTSAIQQLKKEKKGIAVARLMSALAGFAAAWYYWPASLPVICSICLGTYCLTYFIFRDTDKSLAIKNRERLILVNRHETDAMQHQLKGYEDGNRFSEPAHPYASDLDIFGEFSLYQWISRCHSDQSKELLAFHLKNPERPEQILKRQQAAKELSGNQKGCQQFQSTAMANPLTYETEKKLMNWLSHPIIGYEAPFWKWFQNIYPIFPAFVFALYLLDWISINAFLLGLSGFYVLHFLISRKILPEFTHLLNICLLYTSDAADE